MLFWGQKKKADQKQHLLLVQPSYFSVRITLADDGRAQVTLVICLQGMRWVALAREATGKTHVHFVVKAGDEAVNFQVVDAQLEIDGLIFHKNSVFDSDAYCYRVSAYPLIAQYLK